MVATLPSANQMPWISTADAARYNQAGYPSQQESVWCHEAKNRKERETATIERDEELDDKLTLF